MQFFTITALAAALAGTAFAVPSPTSYPKSEPTLNPHITDFRLYSKAECDQTGNQGIWTVVSQDFTNGECKSLNSEYKAVILEDINIGCNLTVYEASDCSFGASELNVQECSTATVQYNAWSVTCKNHN